MEKTDGADNTGLTPRESAQAGAFRARSDVTAECCRVFLQGC